MVSMVFLVYHCLVLKEKKMLFVLDICIALEETSREISQNLQKNTCAKVYFLIKLWGLLCQSLFLNKVAGLRTMLSTV